LAASEEVAKLAQWQEVEAVYHLLTGYAPERGIRSTVRFHPSVDGSDNPSIDVTVLDPEGTTTREMAEAFGQARRLLERGDRSRRRAVRLETAQRLLAFVAEDGAALSWPERHRLWNDQHPDALFPSHDAMRRAFARAAR
jgi:hypothetical protein